MNMNMTTFSHSQEQEKIKNIVSKCFECLFFLGVRKERSAASVLQIGECTKHGKVHSLDHAGFSVFFDSMSCQEFVTKGMMLRELNLSVRVLNALTFSGFNYHLKKKIIIFYY